MDKISSDDERMTKLLALLFDQITRDKMRLIVFQLANYRQMLANCIFEQENHDVLLNVKKLPQASEVGWRSFKRCPMTMSKEERKRVVWESFVDCVRDME